MSTRSDSPAKLGIQAFYSIRGVDDPADIVWKREERDDFRPVSPPGLGDSRIFLAPCAFGKVFEGELTGIGVLGLVDLLQRRGNRLAVLVRDEGERMADEMDDAGLHLGLRNTAVIASGKPLSRRQWRSGRPRRRGFSARSSP